MSSRRVRQKVARRKAVVSASGWEIEEIIQSSGRTGGGDDDVDWTSLPDDTVIQLFSCLNYRDRASLSLTCKSWRALGTSPCLWYSLDLRAHKCDTTMAVSLASRCANLRKLRFRGAESANAIIFLEARNLRDISGDYCRKITDATLSVIAARHELLESLQLGPDFCEKISGDAIKAVATCCLKLRTLRLSGIREIDADAINALAKHCPNLIDIGFLDCLNVDEGALENVVCLRFLSVAGTTNINWNLASLHWSELPNLIGLDVSRTDIGPAAVSRLVSLSQSLRVLCALNCQNIEAESNFFVANTKGKLLLTLSLDIFKGVSSLFVETMKNEWNVFLNWRYAESKVKNSKEIMTWLEWTLSHSLLRIAESNPPGLDNFWLNQGSKLFLSIMQSTQEDVQERAATGLATFVVIDDENASIDGSRAEAVMKGGGVNLLLNLARSWHEGLQAESAKAVANLSVNTSVAKAVAEGGGITILVNLARSLNRLVAEEAAGGLWNLSVGEEHKGAIADSGGVKALVDLIFKWSDDDDGVLERAAGALANLAADDKCSMEVALVGGVHALVMLARNCKFEGVQEQAARALANLAAHGDSNNNNSAVGQEAGALEALVQLTHSPHEGVRQEAAGALWNLSFDDRNREAIAAANGVEALVALAQSCSNASPGLQERAAGALWGLSVSEANSIAIGREGGLAPLITLARSEIIDVHETAAGALWNLAFNPGNAFRIVEEGGVPALVHLCSSSMSKMASFMAALALAYMFDGRVCGGGDEHNLTSTSLSDSNYPFPVGPRENTIDLLSGILKEIYFSTLLNERKRMDEVALVGMSTESISKCLNLEGARKMALKHIEDFVLSFSDLQALVAAASSSASAALVQVTEVARIQEAGNLRCSGAEIGRFVTMLRNPSPVLKACAAFALLQFTIPGGRHATHHANILQNGGATRVLRSATAAAIAPPEARIFARIVLRNLDHHQSNTLA